MRGVLSQLVGRADRWAHFHRFQWRSLCDVHDWLLGMPLGILLTERRDGRKAHSRMTSYWHHPSTQGVEG